MLWQAGLVSAAACFSSSESFVLLSGKVGLARVMASRFSQCSGML